MSSSEQFPTPPRSRESEPSASKEQQSGGTAAKAASGGAALGSGDNGSSYGIMNEASSAPPWVQKSQQAEHAQHEQAARAGRGDGGNSSQVCTPYVCSLSCRCTLLLLLFFYL